MHETAIALARSSRCRVNLTGFASWIALSCLAGLADAGPAASPGHPWPRHTIDATSIGADGVRLLDVNADGRLDVTTGWEEGGRVRVYLHPGANRVRSPWPAVTVGAVASVEDAVFVDLDADGAVDVVSSCEGRTQSMFVHWAPKAPSRYREAAAWTTAPIPASQHAMQWMFCLPLDIDGQHGVDLVAAGKNRGGQVGWWEAPAHPRRLADWKWHRWLDAGWVMSLVAVDMDADHDPDVLVTDRKGKHRGCFWLENPGTGTGRAATIAWTRHDIGGANREVMFLAVADLDQDQLADVLVSTKPREILFLRRRDAHGRNWTAHTIHMPAVAGTAKAVNAGDIDLDGHPDLVFTCEGAGNDKHGVMWLSYAQSPFESDWQAHTISGTDGIKFDLVELLDLDNDGDLDVITCEERRQLGVVWYENPTR